MSANKPIIEFQNVNLKFGSKQIFEDFNFSINKNDQVVAFGKSGLGKSTLLKVVLGFETPETGKAFFNGFEVNPKNILKIRSQIAYVDQDVMMGEGKVSEIVEEYFELSVNKPKDLSIEKLIKSMAEFELNGSLLEKDINQLSGGERQRLAIALSLTLDRPVMILDEVTSALDPVSKKIVIENLLKQTNKTILIITHDKEWQEQQQVKIFNFENKKWIQ